MFGSLMREGIVGSTLAAKCYDYLNQLDGWAAEGDIKYHQTEDGVVYEIHARYNGEERIISIVGATIEVLNA